MHKSVTADNGFETIEIRNDIAAAKIALQGAHLFEYTRLGEPPLLWLSPIAFFETGTAIRGGIPVCWPWFGKNAAHPEWPQHGFARTALWSLEGIDETDAHLSVVTLSLNHTQTDQSFFPYRFRLTLRIAVGESLSVSMTTENLDKVPFEITEALHTYVNIGDIDALHVYGLEDVTYADATDGFALKASPHAVAVTGETDRVYLDTENIVTIKDERYGRSVVVEKEGSHSTVVWNPWVDKAARLGDFDDAGYTSMVCIETANALENSVTIAPGASHTLTQTVR